MSDGMPIPHVLDPVIILADAFRWQDELPLGGEFGWEDAHAVTFEAEEGSG